jgi:hypothetical protein
MTRSLRVGVIGANPNRSWAKDSHIPALRSLENVQLAAVATTSRASADAAAAAFDVPVAAMYCALARDISSGEHTTPAFDHALRLTHLLDGLVQSADTGHRLTLRGWSICDR